MLTIIIIVFVLGYLAIALEHPLRINKAAPALITGVICWVLYILQAADHEHVVDQLLHHLGEIASILFFLLGAMTIVELIDSHNGFDVVTARITTTSTRTFFFIITVLSFFLSAILDNLTTAIVMSSLLGKVLKDREERLWFAGMIVIAANAGGAWSPLGDVTTTMLWIGGQITALNIMKELILPSFAVCIVPALIISFRFRNKTLPVRQIESRNSSISPRESNIILLVGLCLLLMVPVFKTLTHLPPFMGMLLALGIMWIVTSILHRKDPEKANYFTVANALEKIDTPSILFFLGILLAVGALQSVGILNTIAGQLSSALGNDYAVGASLGVVSALVDNVPLVAAAQGMYDLTVYPTDHHFWEFLALTTGTGGSMIIIGSAAGVAIMGIEKIDFGWYLKRIAFLALLGFLAGIGVFLLQLSVTG